MKLQLPRFLRSRKFWQRSAFAVAALATLIAAFYAIENERGKAAWAHYRIEATARGVKLDWRDFIPPPIPDEENFAAIPIMLEREALDPAKRVIRPEMRPFARMPNAYGNARLGERMRFEDWQKCFLEERLLTDLTSDPLADVLRALERCEPILAQFRGAMVRPHSQLVADWEKGPDADFWQLGNQLNIAKMFSLRVTALLASGRNEEALADWRVQLRHADILHNSPTLLAGMLRVILMTMSVNTAWRGIAEEQWNDAQLAEIELALRPIDLTASYARELQSERAFLNLMLDRVKHEPRLFHEFVHSRGKEGSDWERFLPTGWINQNQLRINQWFDAEFEKGEQPTVYAKGPHPPRQLRRWNPYSFIVDSMVSGFGGNGFICEQVQVDIELCRVACALKRFQLLTEKYPQSLEDLVPKLLPSIPVDRFDGQPLRYRAEGEGLVLYLVDSDRSDDGGIETKDIVWRVPASKLGR